MTGTVRKRGDKWYYSFEAGTINGKRKRVERVGGNTKKEAEKALREALNGFENAGSHIDENNISVADYFDHWFKEYVEIKGYWWKSDDGRVDDKRKMEMVKKYNSDKIIIIIDDINFLNKK